MTDNTSTALITGGTSGIGLATAKKLAQLGIHVLVVGRNAERGNKAVEEIRTGGGKADFISSELLGADSAREVARKAIDLGSGHVDILINNAGIYPFGPTHEMTEEQFDRVFSTNVKAPGHQENNSPAGPKGRSCGLSPATEALPRHSIPAPL